MSVSGTEGYAENAGRLAGAFESVSFARLHATVLHLIPPAPCRVLDIGAGTGRDAAEFAAMGHCVVAAEPVAELRTRAADLHRSPRIEWLDDSLPDLARLVAAGTRFDLIMLSAVWMHLDAAQRRQAMPKVAGLLQQSGVVILSLRHGPVPAGRRMFDVSADETITLAGNERLRPLLRLDHQPSQFNRSDVTWTRLAFGR